MTRKAHAAVLFSGGSDSTLAAALMLDEFEKVTLLTFDPGHIFFVDNMRVHGKALQERFGSDRVDHQIVDIKEDYIKQILRKDTLGDLKEYGFNMSSLVCLGCRLSMHACAIVWCLRNEVPYLGDGAIRVQSTIPEQLESVIKRNRRIYSRKYGIRTYSPIYEEAESDRRLEELGIADKRKLKKQFILFDTQATCIFGVPADVYGRLFYGKLVGGQREGDSQQYLNEKYPEMEDTIAREMHKAGVDLDTSVERLKEIRRNDGDLGQGAEPTFDKAVEAGVDGGLRAR
jgi:hypothetical protein